MCRYTEDTFAVTTTTISSFLVSCDNFDTTVGDTRMEFARTSLI